MLTKINECGAIGKVRIFVESYAIKYLKTFRIIYSEMLILLLILCR